jgi:hypothetical protein
MAKSTRDDLAAHLTRESIATRMEAFADEFVRLARTAEQRELAERFSHAVDLVTDHPLGAAEIGQLGEWLSDTCDHAEQVAMTREQKELVASFRTFVGEVTSCEVKDVFQRPLVNQLLDVMEWEMEEGHVNGIPLAHLSPEDRKGYMAGAIDWIDYLDRGLELEADRAAHIGRIIDNAISGKPRWQRMGPSEPPALGLGELRNHASDRMAVTPEMENDLDMEM